jgi:natural product precursor
MDKKLKKLSLEKEEIVNLNDYEMSLAKGGFTPITSSWPCINASLALSALTVASYTALKDRVDPIDIFDSGDIVDLTAATNNQKACQLPEVVIKAY